MNQLEGLLLLLFFPLGFLLSGYWLAAELTNATPAERLAVSLLAGLASLLLVVAAVNFFVPLALPWAGLGLLPMAVTLAGGRNRRSLLADLAIFGRDRESRMVGLLLGLFLSLLLWPMIADGHRIFYDGSANHDSFFWVAAAEYLKRHNYLEPGGLNATQPLFNAAGAIAGIKPAWGRMGAEGLLALASTLVGASPLKIYLYGTAALFLPWVAAVFLTTKTFFNRQPTPIALVGMAVFQPIFIFYFSNANLANLLGTLTGATAVLALEQALRTPAVQARAAMAWMLLLTLSVHGLFCSYPEMVPFVALSCGFLWLRGWFGGETRAGWKRCLAVGAGAMAGLLVNPATTIRACYGFMAVLGLARANQFYANVFAPLSAGEYLPGLASLAIPSARLLGDWLGGLLSLVLLACLGLAFWRSRDRFGALAIFAGSGAMLAYTIATDFAYGWQKTIQFSGIFVATVVPVAVLDALARERQLTDFRRWLAWAGTAAIALFMGVATVQSCLDIYKWSNRKVISADWFALRDQSRTTLRQAPVLVDTGTFRWAFFHSMWSAYFLPDSHIYFAAPGELSGGYLRDSVVNEQNHVIPRPAAVLVGHDWADTFDANSPRLYTGREYTLLQKNNRVFKLSGGYPLTGVPDFVSVATTMEILPHSPCNLLLELAPRSKAGWPAGAWQLTRHAEGAEDFTETVSGPSPWHLVIPLVAARRNQVTITLAGHNGPTSTVSFAVRTLRIEDSP